MPVQFEESAQGNVLDLLGEHVMTVVQGLADYEVIGQSDVDTMLAHEAMKDAFACPDSSPSSHSPAPTECYEPKGQVFKLHYRANGGSAA